MITKNGIFSIYFDIKTNYIWINIVNTENGNSTSSSTNIVNGKIDWTSYNSVHYLTEENKLYIEKYYKNIVFI